MRPEPNAARRQPPTQAGNGSTAVRRIAPAHLADRRRPPYDAVEVPEQHFRQLLSHLAVAVAHDCRSSGDRGFVYRGNPFGAMLVWLWEEGRAEELAHTVRVLATELADVPGAPLPHGCPERVGDLVRRCLPAGPDSHALVAFVERTVRSMPTSPPGTRALTG